MVAQGVPAVRRIAQPEFCDGAFAEAALLIVVESDFAAVGQQRVVEEACSFAVHFIDAAALFRHGGVVAVRRHHHACPVAQKADRLHVVEVFDAADEVDHLAARAAAEAVVALVFGIHGKGGRFFVMERTEPDQIASAPAQRHIAGNDLLNIAAHAQLLQKRVVKSRHEKTSLQVSDDCCEAASYGCFASDEGNEGKRSAPVSSRFARQTSKQ